MPKFPMDRQTLVQPNNMADMYPINALNDWILFSDTSTKNMMKKGQDKQISYNEINTG